MHIHHLTDNDKVVFVKQIILKLRFEPGVEAQKSGLEEAVNRPKLAFAVSQKYLSNETKIYIFITRIPRVVYIIFWGFFKNLIFPTSGRYLQTSALTSFRNYKGFSIIFPKILDAI